MPETVELEVQTTVSIIGDAISIRTYYDTSEVDTDTIEAFISDVVQIIDGVPIIEGELCIRMEDSAYPSDIDYTINEDGELIVTSDNADNYSIDSAGDLIYTEL